MTRIIEAAPELQTSQMSFTPLNVAIVATAGDVRGGAERLYSALAGAVSALGHQVKVLNLPSPEPDFETICENYNAFEALDVSRFDVVISTKAPTFSVNHPNHVVYLVHTVRAYDDMFDALFAPIERPLAEQRRCLHQMDVKALSAARRIFTIGHEVSARLFKWRGLDSTVLHPPLAVDGFYNNSQGDYFFMPGRLHAWKRVHLAIEAVLASTKPLRLIVSGTGDDEVRLKQLARDDSRIEFIGHISDEEMVGLYANALAVPFVSVREDYGYVTLEAFASGKPVLTCQDSGEPTRFVIPGETGLVCEATAESVRLGLEWLFDNRSEAARMGLAGAESIAGMCWQSVAAELIAAAMAPASGFVADTEQQAPYQVVTVDMQPIDPPVGGGRLRLLGLYHGLGLPCNYVGTFDWPNEPARDHKLSATLREISVPLSDAHHNAAAAMALKCNGKTVIDLAFSQQGHLSPAFVARVQKEIKQADVVVFSHPWVYPLVASSLLPHQVVVYDSQNVEGFLRAQLLDESNPAEQAVLRQAVADEYDVATRADLVLACSQEDLTRFNRIYELNPEKMRVIPNGVMAFGLEPVTPQARGEARERLGLAADMFIGVFIGSPYGPNVDAAKFIATSLAPAMTDIHFVIAGGVSDTVSQKSKNLTCTGGLSEQGKLDWLQAADIALNPMFSGSGTNIKMFDFMALGLPTVVTETGARGINPGPDMAFLTVANTQDAFVAAIRKLQQSPKMREDIARAARLCVENQYAWERISCHLGRIFTNRARWSGEQRPLFSVVIPTYERHGQLTQLLEILGQQLERDFEVVIVDQSAHRWPLEHSHFGMPVTYIHTDVKGAVNARNTGAAVANGQVIAFTDDDCLPSEDWLFNARGYFDNNTIVGLEGAVVSDHHGDPQWRTVTNIGFEGMGFMTANMMVRSSAFQLLGGFDLAFDKPHFREDTDFGWRLQELGVVPYGRNVEVFHPAQPRSDERESVAARAVFFSKDAMLYQKHPERYRELFFAEKHFQSYPGFTQQLKVGFEQQNIAMPRWMSEAINQPS